MITLYDDYNTDNYEDIAEFYGVQQDELNRDMIEDYNYDIYKMFLDDLRDNFTPIDTIFVAQATRETHYPEFYKGESVGYCYANGITDIMKWSDDYNIVEYDTDKHELLMTTIGHDNNYRFIIRPLSASGLKYYNKHKENGLSYYELEKLFTKHTKRLKEVK